MKRILSNVLPSFLFKWDGHIKMTPDLAEIKTYCQKNAEDSFLLHSYKGMAMYLNEVDIAEQDKLGAQAKKNGNRREVLSYLVAEAGSEIEVAWMTSCFYLQAQIKTDDIGKVIRYLTNGKFL